MDIKTKVRHNSHGICYDIYVNGCYRVTAFTAKEIEPLIADIEAMDF